jgi:hypothetical protein
MLDAYDDTGTFVCIPANAGETSILASESWGEISRSEKKRRPKTRRPAIQGDVRSRQQAFRSYNSSLPYTHKTAAFHYYFSFLSNAATDVVRRAIIKSSTMGFTLSATAPQFLPEQERQERETLSEEERAKIYEDLHNGSSEESRHGLETPEMHKQGIEQLTACIEKMSDREKCAYTEAVANAPDLVKQESDPAAFLRCERYNGEVSSRMCGTIRSYGKDTNNILILT